jgi:methyltransferase (TIGR00027 family)
MRPDSAASITARSVAALRGLARYLPPALRELAPDQYGLAFAGCASVEARLAASPRAAAALLASGPLHRAALALTLRTRAIDDMLRAYAAGGGRQVLLLGAGLDARAWRLAAELPAGMRWVEVDHPATQAAKRAALLKTLLPPPAAAAAAAPLPTPDVRFVAHDFEAMPMDALAAALRDAGLSKQAPLLTIWEGCGCDAMRFRFIPLPPSLRKR